MGKLADAIADQTGPMLRYARGMLKEVDPGTFARKPEGPNGPIDTNHPAFVYGHLAIYPERIAELTGAGDIGWKAPAGWEKLFGAGTECKDDPGNTIYPGMEEITKAFFDGYEAVIGAVRGLSDEHLSASHGLESDFGRIFHSRAAVGAFMLGAHPFMHIGQVSAWRRCMGLPSAF